ncbi:DNA cytosine methyltransferase [Paenibacillus pinihumi]|uniref:DNA cytosine methyltransferase n=1 Tax=Paenibacillus pinihumi TaxID=669462 RepID=UPI001FDF4093|nr:DNA cytosine methyltransferase [Paenibacillus pinihumi]
METVVFCEREPFPQRVLRKHWPDVPIIDDVHDFTREEMERRGIGAIDLISAGFPCQPFSHAGKREGAEDERYLWPEVVRVVDDIRPTWFVGENVAGILSMAQPDREIKVVNRISSRTEEEDFYEAVFTQQEVMLIHDICKDLENIGYQVQVYILPAAAVGASNPRDRVFLVAHTEIDTSGGLSIREGETDAGLARTCSDVEHPECIRCGGVTRRGTEPQPADRYSGGQGGVMADTSSEGLSQRGRSRRAEGNPEAGTGLDSESERCCEVMADSQSIRRRNGDDRSNEWEAHRKIDSPANASGFARSEVVANAARELRREMCKGRHQPLQDTLSILS